MRTALGVLIFLSFLNLYTGFHGFLFFRALKKKFEFKLPFFVYWIVFFVIAAFYCLIRYGQALRSLFGLANAYWGLMLFFPFLVGLDFLYLVRFILRFVRREKRRPAGTFTLVSHIAVIVFVTSTALYGSWQARHPVLTEYKIKTEKPLPGGKLDIILVSDIHIGAMVHKKHLAGMVEKISALDRDIVFIAGDILDMDMNAWTSENLSEEMSHLNAPLGVWAVPGNHDYYGGVLAELKEALTACGISLLLDEAVLLDGFYVIGRIDLSAGWNQRPQNTLPFRKTPTELVEGLDIKLPLILIDHQPSSLKDAEAAGIDLQVSGHTHHGQIWPGSVITKRLYENDYGLLYKGKSAFVVTSGYGTWGPSLRIGTAAEIVRIRLTNGL
jgi:predicted MPP superfamily phosphohydrolase